MERYQLEGTKLHLVMQDKEIQGSNIQHDAYSNNMY